MIMDQRLGKLETDTSHTTVTTYKTHAMTTHHGGARHAHKALSPGCRNLDSHIEDARGIDIGPDNDNASTNSLGTTIASG